MPSSTVGDFGSYPKFASLHPAIEKGIEKIKKWHKNVKELDTYFTCLALCPGIELDYCKEKWDLEAYATGYSKLEKKFDSYYKALKKPKFSTTSNKDKSPDTTKSFHNYGSNFILSALTSSSSQQSNNEDPQKEL
ncbi:hypothetical protein BDZ97DRAFT_1928334 [Flammula alnicola]|nr:hypothetical protein BDZ97DRAFT_1928334 [Flammula alnicola]